MWHLSMQSTVVAFRKFSTLHRSRPPRRAPRIDWPTCLVLAAMALLAVVGYWSDQHFEGLSQGQEWSVDTSDTE